MCDYICFHICRLVVIRDVDKTPGIRLQDKASMSRTPDKEHMNQTHCSMFQTIFIHNVNDPVLCKTDPVHTKLDTMNVPDKHGQIQTDSVMSQMISQVMSQVMQNDLTDHLHDTCNTSEPP